MGGQKKAKKTSNIINGKEQKLLNIVKFNTLIILTII